MPRGSYVEHLLAEHDRVWGVYFADEFERLRAAFNRIAEREGLPPVLVAIEEDCPG